MKLPAGTILGPYDNRDDWLRARRAGIGGSDIATILGLSTFSSELAVYQSKVDGIESEPNEQMEIGRDIESWILSRWSDSSGERGIYSGLVIIQSDVHPYLMHSPDALLCNTDTEVINLGRAAQVSLVPHTGVEIKNVRTDRNWDPLPEFYMAQVQHGLLCSGLDRWIVVALVGGQKLITREIEPDREFQGRIALAAERFWTTHILPQVPPEPDGSDSAKRALERRWDTSEGNVEIPAGMAETVRYYQGRIETDTKALNAAKQAIMSKMGHAEVALVEGKKFATWKVGTEKRVDVKRLRDEDPKLAEKFSTVKDTRTFRLSER